jgi:intracellular sulfur oxidation DsrE/DsrF family protein
MKYPLFLGLVALGFAVSLGFSDEPQESKSKGEKTMLKAVIHVNFSDSDRQKHGLKNVSNILKEVQGEAEIVVACHGEGIGLLVTEKSQHADEVERLIKEKVRFVACENTMRDRSITKDNLLPGVTTIPSGAVEVIRKQQEGYGYFKP